MLRDEVLAVCGICTPSLWVQRFVQEGRVTLAKVPGTEKNGGLKDLQGAMSVFAEGGRSTLALRASGEVKA